HPSKSQLILQLFDMLSKLTQSRNRDNIISHQKHFLSHRPTPAIILSASTPDLDQQHVLPDRSNKITESIHDNHAETLTSESSFTCR
ncbi:1258_t:CDS:2, partial [Ambispora gerdemannii]